MLDLIYKGNKGAGKVRSARLMLERVYVWEWLSQVVAKEVRR